MADSARNLASARETALSRAGKEVLQELVSRGSGPEGMQALYLLVETPIFVAVAEVKPDDEVKARQFLHNVNSAAGSVVALRQYRKQAVAQAQADLDVTNAERDAALSAAQKEVAAVKADTRRVDAARIKVRPPASPPPGPSAGLGARPPVRS